MGSKSRETGGVAVVGENEMPNGAKFWKKQEGLRQNQEYMLGRGLS